MHVHARANKEWVYSVYTPVTPVTRADLVPRITRATSTRTKQLTLPPGCFAWNSTWWTDCIPYQSLWQLCYWWTLCKLLTNITTNYRLSCQRIGLTASSDTLIISIWVQTLIFSVPGRRWFDRSKDYCRHLWRLGSPRWWCVLRKGPYQSRPKCCLCRPMGCQIPRQGRDLQASFSAGNISLIILVGCLVGVALLE